MNILHFKYAVEIADTKSISKAAERLYMGQPNLSRAIKELEEDLGIVIFERNPRGIKVTPEGEEFLQYARSIISQVDEVERIYKGEDHKKQKFAVCVPRASYISYALAEFAKHISLEQPADIFYKETNSMRTIDNVLKDEYNLGIIRYQTTFDKYFQDMFQEKKIVAETITEFKYELLVSAESKLAKKKVINKALLSDYVEIAHGDPYVPSLPVVDVKRAELSENVDKRIFLFERASQFLLLEQVPTTFMWVSPIPKPLIEKYNLVQKLCDDNNKSYKDVLIYKKGYKLSELDQHFITEVISAKRKYL